jgi:predicted RNA methylase
MSELSEQLKAVYATMEGSPAVDAYAERHDIHSAAILTVHDDETADLIAGYLAPRIEGKIVVEIGGGIGLLALHMADYAKRVFCIEANPMWSWTFAALLLTHKPKNVSYLFGTASEFEGQLRGDVALFCTHSDTAGMREAARPFADTIIDVYGEVALPHENELRMARRVSRRAPQG